jgi:hypothetical protein
MKLKTILIAILLALLFTYVVMAQSRYHNTDILNDTFAYNQHSKASVDITDLLQGCRARDCIPAINQPIFASAKEFDAQQYLGDNELVMLVDYNKIQKAYPLKIMQGHEVVNDKFNGKALVVSYCPLCASAVAFIPQVNGDMVEFGVSGLLHNSDLVMYDRKTYSLWGQITARAIMGPQTGHQLKRVYVAQISWAQAKANFPQLHVLLPPLGSRQNYQRDFYQGYFSHDNTMFPVSLKDARLLQKSKVHGFIIDEQPIAVEAKYLTQQNALLLNVNGHQLNIVQKSDGTVSVKDSKTNQSYVPTLVFWFAWYNFHPTTQLFSHARTSR